MPFGVTPAANQPVLPAAPADVQAINFLTGGLIVTRGVGDNSHVVTLRRAGATCLFLEQFLGPAGPITGHQPNVAPTGFAYANAGFGPNTTLALTGAGSVTGVQVGYGTAGVADASASVPPFALSLTTPFTFLIALRPSDSMANSVVGVRLLNTADNSLIELYIERDGAGNYTARVDCENNGVFNGYAYWQKATTAGEHTISVHVLGSTILVSLDGGTAEPPYAVGTDPLPTDFTELRYLVDVDSPSDNSNLSLVSLCDGPAAPAGVPWNSDNESIASPLGVPHVVDFADDDYTGRIIHFGSA